jgi:hypothetical protein
VEGLDEINVDEAVKQLLESLPSKVVLRVESEQHHPTNVT